MGVLDGKTIVLGVSGGIAAYKSAELVRLLVTSGANVRVMMTRNATEFITPLTLQTLSANPVATDTFSLTQESEIGHIRLADSADAIVIAPATADVIAKAAVGIADDIVTTVLLATRAKVAFAPAMNVHMYEHPTVAENLAKLRARGAVIIEPGEGALACGYEGKGRLPDPAIVVAEIEKMLSAQDLAGEKILVTAGPTREPIDPVRFVSNSSSGKMGFAIARAAWRRGASVRIVAGPSALATPYGVERIDTVTASAMLAKTTSNFPWSTALVMAAAVADFRPANPARRQDQERCARSSTRDGVDRGRDAADCGEEGRAHPDRIRGRDRRPRSQRARQAQAQRTRPDRRQRRDTGGRRLRGRYQYRHAHRR